MYDTSFDHRRAGLRRIDQGALWALRIAAALAVLMAAEAGGQLPGAPVLQNAWVTPGLAAAIDVGGGGGSVFAGALAWAAAGGRFQLSGAYGSRARSGYGSAGAYGVRATVPFGGTSSAFGFAAFAGIGGGRSTSPTVGPIIQQRVPDSSMSTTQVPVGVALGWRVPIGATHGISLYATPSYVFLSGGSHSGGLLRAAAGVDFGVTPAIGITGGLEFGQTRPRSLGGPNGVLYGFGLSYAFGRR